MENLNMSTHEVYCSLDICKLLKQAGFDWKCREYYYNFTTTGWSLSFDEDFVNWNSWGKQYISAPTLDVAQRWLREVRKHDVFVSPCNGLYFYIIRKYYHEGKVDYFDYPNKDAFDTYEEALEAGIKKALEIILEKGE